MKRRRRTIMKWGDYTRGDSLNVGQLLWRTMNQCNRSLYPWSPRLLLPYCSVRTAGSGLNVVDESKMSPLCSSKSVRALLQSVLVEVTAWSVEAPAPNLKAHWPWGIRGFHHASWCFGQKSVVMAVRQKTLAFLITPEKLISVGHKTSTLFSQSDWFCAHLPATPHLPSSTIPVKTYLAMQIALQNVAAGMVNMP